MGNIFDTIPNYINDNLPQLHQGMGIENIIWLYAYGFGLVTFMGAVIMIMVARRLVPVDYDETPVVQVASEDQHRVVSDVVEKGHDDSGGESDQDEEDPKK